MRSWGISIKRENVCCFVQGCKLQIKAQWNTALRTDTFLSPESPTLIYRQPRVTDTRYLFIYNFHYVYTILLLLNKKMRNSVRCLDFRGFDQSVFPYGVSLILWSFTCFLSFTTQVSLPQLFRFPFFESPFKGTQSADAHYGMPIE